MSALDINTPKGREAAADQQRATEIVFGNSATHRFIHTPTNGAAVVDGFIVRDGIATGIAEAKSRRDMTYGQLMVERDAEWLLTYQKLLDIQSISRLLHLPSYGFVYLTQDDMVLVVSLTNGEGEFVCQYRTEETETQRCVNGGTARRVNAFINVAGAKIYRSQPQPTTAI